MNPRIKAKGEEPGVGGRRRKSQLRAAGNISETPALKVQERSTVPHRYSFPFKNAAWL